MKQKENKGEFLHATYFLSESKRNEDNTFFSRKELRNTFITKKPRVLQEKCIYD